LLSLIFVEAAEAVVWCAMNADDSMSVFEPTALETLIPMRILPTQGASSRLRVQGKPS
jgi:hypothetical protein